MIKFSSSFKLNEIYVVDSPFNEDPKNINFFQGGPNFGEGRPENLRKWTITGTPIVMQIGGGGEFRKRISVPTTGTKILVMPQFFYMQTKFKEKNEKNSIFRPKFDLSLRSSPPKM